MNVHHIKVHHVGASVQYRINFFAQTGKVRR
jgi:hypothetical protein